MYKPILFNGEMVRAILDGRKNQTRRVIKPQPNKQLWCAIKHETKGRACWMEEGADQLNKDFRFYKSHEVCDILYVRETTYIYGHWNKNGITKTGKQKWMFTRDWSKPVLYNDKPPDDINRLKTERGYYKRPSMFMPRDAARIFLKVTNVRVERLQDITGEQCITEGVAKLQDQLEDDLCNYCPLPDEAKGVYSTPGGNSAGCEGSHCKDAYENYLSETAIDEFADLWDSIYKNWSDNPWVFVIEFKRVKP